MLWLFLMLAGCQNLRLCNYWVKETKWVTNPDNAGPAGTGNCPEGTEGLFQAGSSLPFAVAGEIAGVVFLLLLLGGLLFRSYP